MIIPIFMREEVLPRTNLNGFEYSLGRNARKGRFSTLTSFTTDVFGALIDFHTRGVRKDRQALQVDRDSP